jgi:hypothetical protein
VVTRNFQILHYQKISSSVQLRIKQKASFENFTFFFNSGKIISSRSRPSFEVLLTGFGNPHSAIGNA